MPSSDLPKYNNDTTIDWTKVVSCLERVGVASGIIAYCHVPGVKYLKPV